MKPDNIDKRLLIFLARAKVLSSCVPLDRELLTIQASNAPDSKAKLIPQKPCASAKTHRLFPNANRAIDNTSNPPLNKRLFLVPNNLLIPKL
ncbi:hypothetical protein ES708_29571 [subsurface metagenome]